MQQTGRICPRGASYYVWQQGDTAQQVAYDNGTTVQALQILNPDVNFTTLTVGSEICLPSQIYTCISGSDYIVRAGDTFDSIAERLGITALEIAERNPGVSSNNLTIGQVLCVPNTGSTGNNGSGGATTDPGQTPVVPLPPIVTGPGQQEPAFPGNGSTGGTSTSACPTGYIRRTVRSGQTYADLLVENNVSYQALRISNPNLSPGYLIAGAAYCAPPAGTRQICSTGTSTYTVQPGETLAMVAERFGTTQGRLLMLNPTLLPTDFSSGTIVCVP
ncbi:MAG: LysM peptidoglycan-binding domain-containing protein [Christensenellaceae bacterium]|nr:LysM peptidoglycan-binding domain-containing protein [Christensenellaceae bacterium]